MYALKVLRGLYKRCNKYGLKNKLVKSSKNKISTSTSTSTSSSSRITPSLVTISHSKRKFHRSPAPRWQTPDQLSTSELRRECDRRSLSTKGSRTALVERLKNQLQESGGYDNGLTLDDNLANRKRQIESELNKIPDKHFSV